MTSYNTADQLMIGQYILQLTNGIMAYHWSFVLYYVIFKDPTEFLSTIADKTNP